MKKSKKLSNVFEDLELVENILSNLENSDISKNLEQLEKDLEKLSEIETEYSNLKEEDIDLEEDLDTEK